MSTHRGLITTNTLKTTNTTGFFLSFYTQITLDGQLLHMQMKQLI